MRETLLEDLPFPQADAAALVRDAVTLAVQVNGKLRGTIEVSVPAARDEIEHAALAEPNVAKFMAGERRRRSSWCRARSSISSFEKRKPSIVIAAKRPSGLRRRDDEGWRSLQHAAMKTILYCHHESGHSYKVALALTLIGIPFEQRPVDLNLPRESAPRGFPPRLDVRRSASADRRRQSRRVPVECDPRSHRAALRQARR